MMNQNKNRIGILVFELFFPNFQHLNIEIVSLFLHSASRPNGAIHESAQFTSVGCRVQRMTNKELCHISETWHVSYSISPDTNCSVSLHINPHSISNSGL